jgi:response regulator RpfG family c-di-GMP phosphodiesterase
LQLAGHNGIEFLYELRSYGDWQHVPVIIHTLVNRRSLELSQELLTALGVIRYLYKPATSLQKLKRVVEEVLQPAAL